MELCSIFSRRSGSSPGLAEQRLGHPKHNAVPFSCPASQWECLVSRLKDEGEGRSDVTALLDAHQLRAGSPTLFRQKLGVKPALRAAGHFLCEIVLVASYLAWTLLPGHNLQRAEVLGGLSSRACNVGLSLRARQ